MKASMPCLVGTALVLTAVLAGCAGRSAAGPTAPTTWTWQERSITFTLGGGRRQPRHGYLDGSGQLIDDRQVAHPLESAVLGQLDRWLHDPDVLGRRAAELNCSAGNDEEYLIVALAVSSTLPQPFTFCTHDLTRVDGGGRLRSVVDVLRLT
jgi:hypothetical protein